MSKKLRRRPMTDKLMPLTKKHPEWNSSQDCPTCGCEACRNPNHYDECPWHDDGKWSNGARKTGAGYDQR